LRFFGHFAYQTKKWFNMLRDSGIPQAHGGPCRSTLHMARELFPHLQMTTTEHLGALSLLRTAQESCNSNACHISVVCPSTWSRVLVEA
jgi:hypothetical protein